ncbi:MAG: ATP adenylyltransferase family protein [Nitrospirota bacterium]
MDTGTLEKGMLWPLMLKTGERALRTGALRSYPTEQAFIEEKGVHFFVRVMAALRQKAASRQRQDADAGAGKPANPFLPPEKDLTVGNITDTHIAVLNKFNVVDHHLLIVTRSFEDQTMLLTLADFEALWLCMAEFDSLGFYNGGREAGASQEHKHLQVVPLPLAPNSARTPIEPLLPVSGPPAEPVSVPAFAFRHAFVRLRPGIEERPREAALETFDLYTAMLGRVGMSMPGDALRTRQSMPYCLLITRQWMLLIPRSREHFEEISLNSLAFAGSFFVWNDRQLGRLKAAGPLKALAAVSVPR